MSTSRFIRTVWWVFDNIFLNIVKHLNIDLHPVDVSFTLFPSTSQYTITKIGTRQLDDEEKATGFYAPIAPITLEGFARSIANIPDDATHFCWFYPPKNILDNHDIDFDNSYEENLLKIGGFVYFKEDKDHGNTLQVVCVNSLIVSATNGLNFEGPYPWRKEFTDHLWTQNRFQVSLFFLLYKNNEITIMLIIYLACNFIISSWKRCTILCFYLSIWIIFEWKWSIIMGTIIAWSFCVFI